MIAIIDYGMGNLRSVANSLESLGFKTEITDQPAIIKKADGLILPGVGAFGDGMKNLAARHFIELLSEEVVVKGKPILCICLGQQLITTESTEFGIHEGLGWIQGKVTKIESLDRSFKIPHMGWNDVQIIEREPLFVGMRENPVFYFVHSYHVKMYGQYNEIVSSTCYHGTTITASLQYKNIFAVQFHPEKSQEDGLMLLNNFGKLL